MCNICFQLYECQVLEFCFDFHFMVFDSYYSFCDNYGSVIDYLEVIPH